eukprot:jgi/Mesvir1/14727/Mv05375-RA.1
MPSPGQLISSKLVINGIHAASKIVVFLAVIVLPSAHATISATLGGSEIEDYPYAVDWDDGMCAIGVKQSPIDIATSTVHVASTDDVVKRLRTDWRADSDGMLKVTNHNVEYELSEEASARSTLISNTGETFYLKQFHVHHPSEHSVDVLPPQRDLHNPLGNTPDLYHTDFARMAAENSSYYYYDGSLTTPPCSEIVSWHVMRKSVPISPRQVQRLQQVLYAALGTHGQQNSRPPQPLNFRPVYLYRGADYPPVATAPSTPCSDAPDIIIQGGAGASGGGDPSSVAVAGLAIACTAALLSLLAVVHAVTCVATQARGMVDLAIAGRDTKALPVHPVAA